MATSSQFRYSGDIQGNDINHNLPVRFDADGSGCVGITQPDSARRKGLDRVLLTSQQVVALFEFCEGKRVGITGALKPNYRRTLKCEECSVEVNSANSAVALDGSRYLFSTVQPTPADEEVARAVVGTVFHNTDASLETLERTMMERITAALAEAHRAGTPTADARAETIAGSSYENVLAGVLAVHRLDCTLLDFARGLRYYAEQESRKPNPDTHLIAVLQRAACVGWENIQMGKSAISSTPSDEVAQRARAVKIRTAAEDVWNKFWNDLTSDGWSVDDLEAILRLHFTATDVEQGTCTWTLGIDAEWYTECGFALDTVRRTEAMKFCAFCGKPLAEAAKEITDGN